MRRPSVPISRQSVSTLVALPSVHPNPQRSVSTYLLYAATLNPQSVRIMSSSALHLIILIKVPHTQRNNQISPGRGYQRSGEMRSERSGNCSRDP